MFVVIMSRSNSNLGHVGLKTRSVGQIEQKSCFHTGGHIFDPVSMKLGQNVRLMMSGSGLDLGHIGSITRS